VSLRDLDWGHVVLLVLLIASLIAHFRTSRRKRFSMTFTLKREHDDSISNMGPDAQKPPD
jgi:hypothetical protein